MASFLLVQNSFAPTLLAKTSFASLYFFVNFIISRNFYALQLHNLNCFIIVNLSLDRRIRLTFAIELIIFATSGAKFKLLTLSWYENIK